MVGWRRRGEGEREGRTNVEARIEEEWWEGVGRMLKRKEIVGWDVWERSED